MKLQTPAARPRLWIIIGAAVLLGAVMPGVASALDRPATPATFGSVWNGAQAGDRILLAPGDYGTFHGSRKTGVVTIASQPGAVARMRLEFSGVSNIAIEGLALGEISMQDGTSDVTVRNSTIDGQTVLRTGTLANSNILFDGNHHVAWDKCGDCGEGRFFMPERTDQPSGITIQNSKFGPGGNSDGIQNGSNGTRILNNEFTGIKQIDGDDVHADSIQLYGSRNTVISGNYFHDVSVGIMCADGCDHETVQDNVFDVDGSPYAVTWLSDSGSVIRHNTFAGEATCDYRQRCGVLYLGNKSQDPVSRGTIVKDNILTRICVCDGSVSGLAVEDHNLLREGGSGANDLRGAPTYAGGSNPGSAAGFALAAGSLGRGDASDGTDRGARPGAGAGAAAAAAPPAASRVRVRVRSTLRGAIRTGWLRLAISTPRTATVSYRVSIRRGRTTRGAGRSRKFVRLKNVRLGRRAAGSHRVAVRLTRRMRRSLNGSRGSTIAVRVTVGSRSTTVRNLTFRR